MCLYDVMCLFSFSPPPQCVLEEEQKCVCVTSLVSVFSSPQCVLEEEQKYLKLLELLGLHQESGAVLVFVDKQEHADELTKRLMDSGYPCMPIHGGIDQYDRDSTISDFKAGSCKLLVSRRDVIVCRA